MVYNSTSKVLNLNAIQEKKLKADLSYTIGDHFSGFGPRKKSLLSKTCSFPTGLLARVRLFLVNSKIPYTLQEHREEPEPVFSLSSVVNHNITPYSAQEAAVKAALRSHRGIISMPTGTGKSLVIALIAARLGVKTLVVVPSLEIKKQLAAGLLEALNDTSLITVENIDSSKLDKMTDFGCFIIDEAHHVAAKTYQKLNVKVWNNIYYRFFLTATPFRNDLEEMMLFEAIAGRLIYQLTYKEAIAANYIVPVESYYIEIPKQPTEAYTWAQVYSELVVNHSNRNVIIASLLLRLQLAGKSTLLLVKEVKHGEILADLTGLPFVSGADESSRDYIRQFNSGDQKVLIGTEGILGEGVDTKPCEYVIIAGLGKAKSAFMQKVGRGVRQFLDKDSCKVILIRDTSHKFCVKHFNAQKKILLDEYGSKITKLEF